MNVLYLVVVLVCSITGTFSTSPLEHEITDSNDLNPFSTIATLNEDSSILVKLFEATAGATWTTPWDTSTAIADWEGVILTEDGQHVKRLILTDNELRGTIPSEIGQLQYLEKLDLSNNDLEGDIPSQISNLRALKRLNLSGNQLSGNLPTGLTSLTNLIELILNDNRLEGALPEVWDSLTALKWLYLDDNEFSGIIPSHLGDVRSLTILSLANNELEGELPESITNLNNLSNCYLEGNHLTRLPDLSLLPITLGELRVQENRLSFRDIIPNLSKTGDHYFPQEPIVLESPVLVPGNLMSFSVSLPIEHYNGNEYRWRKNGSLHAIATANELIFNPVSESIVGDYQVEVTNMSAEDLELNSTVLEVRLIPCSSIDSISLSALYTKMNGEGIWNTKWESNSSYKNWFGVEVDSAGCVTGLDLSSNGLTGEAPSEINELLKVKILNLTDNQIQGVSELFDLQKLETIYLGENQLSTLPDFSELAALKELQVQENRLNFSDIAPLLDVDVNVLEISPQDSMETLYNGKLLSVDAGGDINVNTYKWYKRTSAAITLISEESSFEPKAGGWYWCEVSNVNIQGLKLIGKAIFIDKDCPAGLNLIDTIICEDAELVVNGNTYDTSKPKGQEILVGASYNGCDSIIDIMLDFVPCSYIPSGFTPNNDGVNDLFIIPVLSGSQQYPDCELSILNRWGDIVYYAKPYLNNWDGRNKAGDHLPDGTYYYSFRLSPDTNIRFSEVTIIR